ncbi:17402_t:CDS:2 [Gigaspora margarita]|uniref:17402_t:CDS:1 n=1 Tax=Gigaspora margarita TaxID=4874 RepID=A0ABN7VYE0_GIGMA|nr:17402_t:CDS:2 [Gigaspora margarita]
MFKFNPVKYKINILEEIADFMPKDGNESLFNYYHNKFNVLSKDTSESSNLFTYGRKNQNIYFPISTIDNTALKNISFNYKIRTINNISQSLDFEIIESSLSIHYNQFYKVPSPENLIIGLYYGGYSASYIEIKYSNYLYSKFQSLQTMSTLNSKDYKTPNGNHIKQDYSLAKKNIDSYLSYEFQSLRTTNMNDTFDICHLEQNIESLRRDSRQFKNYLSDENTKLKVDIRDFLKELKKFDNFYLLGDIRVIGSVRA